MLTRSVTFGTPGISDTEYVDVCYVRFYSRGYYVVEKVYSGFKGVVHDNYT